MLAKAVACELSADFYHISPADLITSDVGGAERNVARLFRTIRASQRAVLFLDEIDALVPRRRNNGSTIMLRVISQILGEVDGLRSSETKNDLLLIGATNEIEMVDPAMLRPGRFDAKIYVGPPDEAARRTLLKSLLEELPVADEFSLEELVEKTEGLTGAEIKGVIQKAADEAFLRDVAGGKDESLRFKLDSIESTAEISKYQKRARRGSSSTGKRLEPVASGFERTVLRACSESSGHGESHGDELRRES